MMTPLRSFVLVLISSCIAASASPTTLPTKRAYTPYKYIVPGANWLDTDGVLIQAHGGQVVRDGSYFYWFGENHRPNGTLFTGISVYRSSDLYNWQNLGLALSPVAGTQAASDQVGERPKVIYSPTTKQWVMYFHSDNSAYSLHLQGIAFSPTIAGPYKYWASYLPLNANSQDLGLFQDTDGKAYALYGSGSNNDITLLNSDFTNETSIVYAFQKTNLEAPGMLHDQGLYYNFFSQKTGYRPNDAQYYTAPALTGPWSGAKQLAPAGTHTWESQNTFELRINGTKTTTHIFMGDRWDRDQLSDSRYMWLPLTIDGTAKTASLPWRDLWTIDVTTGVVGYPTGVSYEAEAGILSGGATLAACSGCSGSKFVTNITASSSVTIKNIVGTGEPQWVSLYYVNTDEQTVALQRLVSVSINGDATQTQTLKQRTTAANVTVSIPFQATFKKGSSNTVVIKGSGSGFSADFDRLIVYP